MWLMAEVITLDERNELRSAVEARAAADGRVIESMEINPQMELIIAARGKAKATDGVVYRFSLDHKGYIDIFTEHDLFDQVY